MAENLDAEQYRQALRLVLSELEDLDTAHPVDIGYRIGELKVHLRTLIGESGRPPMLGFRGLEDLDRVRKERLGAVLPITARTSTAAPDLRQRGGAAVVSVLAHTATSDVLTGYGDKPMDGQRPPGHPLLGGESEYVSAQTTVIGKP